MKGPRLPPRVLSRLAPLFLLGAASLVSLGVAELGLRLVDLFGISYYPETARWLDTLDVDAEGYRNHPGLRGTYYHASVAINSLGLRDHEISLEPEPGEFRLLVMGDSFPFGIGVPYEQSLAPVLEGKLNEAEIARGRVRAVNMGVVSYNTEQELRQLRELGLGLHPSLVVLFYALNDIESRKWVLEKRSPWYVNLAQRTYLASLAVFAYRNLQWQAGVEPIAIDGYAEDSPRWQAVAAALREMNHLCHEVKARFLVFTLDEKEEPMDLVRDVGRSDGFPVVHLVPWRDPRWSALGRRRFQNSALDAHPNAEGTEIYATLVAEHLLRLGLVGAPAHARP